MAQNNNNPQIIAAVIAAVSAVVVAVIANWHGIFPAPAEKTPPLASPIPQTAPLSAATAPSSTAASPASTVARATAVVAHRAIRPETAGPASDFLLPDSSQAPVTAADIAGLSPAQLRLARNEIYARHGFLFHSPDLQSYFARFSWYRPTGGPISLSPVEQANVALLQQAERARGGT